MSKKNKTQLKKEDQSKQPLVAHHQQISSGPIPSASEMQKYQNIHNDLPLRIMTMAEQEAIHRHQQETKIIQINSTSISSGSKAHLRGQWFGFSLAIIALIATYLLAYLGSNIVAGIVGRSTVVGLVSVFVVGNFLPNNNNDLPNN